MSNKGQLSADVDFNDIIKISQRLNSCVDFVSFYSDLEGILFKYGNCNMFSVIIYYEQTESFFIDYSNALKRFPLNDNNVDISNTVLKNSFLNKKPVYLNSKESVSGNTINVGGNILPILGCEPLTYTNQIYGFIVFHSEDANSRLNQRWLEFIASVASTAIINLQLYQETNIEASENAAKLLAINNAGELFSHMSLDTLLVKIMELALKIVSAQVGSIMLDEHQTLMTKVEWGLKDEVIKNIRHSSGELLVDYVKREKNPFLALEAKEDDRIIFDNLDVDMESLVIIPLYTNERFLGVVNIINSSIDSSGNVKFSNKDIDLLVTITNFLSISIENAILYIEALEKERIKEQLNIARKIQQELMPAKFPDFDDLEIDGVNITCDETGGDYYDYIVSDENKTVKFIIGDVSGHGIGAALFMATARSHIRALTSSEVSLNSAMFKINNNLIGDMEKNDQFMTLLLMTLDINLKELTYVSAGHEVAIVYSPKTDTFTELHSTGVPVGLIDNSEFMSNSCKINHDDIVLLYTDGLKEAMNSKEELFGYERIKEAVKTYANQPVKSIKDNIIRDVTTFCGGTPQQDDWTLVVIKIKDIQENMENKKLASEYEDNLLDDILDDDFLINSLVQNTGGNAESTQKEPAVSYVDKLPEVFGDKIYDKEIQSDLAQKEIILEEMIGLTISITEIDEENEFDIRLALDEAITNGILHGNDVDINKKLFASMIKDEEFISYIVSDEGKGFSDELLLKINTPASWHQENGRGLFLIGKLMDEVIFFNNGSGVIMKKKLKFI